jgi:indole-3-glycerol phosphate synthase
MVPRQSTAEAGFSALEEIKELALSRPAARGQLGRLRDEHVTLIAELDQTHPAAADLGDRYVDAGARGIAVRTRTSDADPGAVAQISARIHAPLLSLEPADSSYRLWWARACGADMVVLPTETLSDPALYSLLERAESIGMAAIVEVRGSADLVRALRAQAKAVLLRPDAGAGSGSGSSSDVGVGAGMDELLSLVPNGVVKVAECGPGGRSSLITCARGGADVVLIGASHLTGTDPASTVAGLAAMGAHPALTARASRSA